jgi:hypothetical protein
MPQEMDMKSIQLSQSIAAAMQLRLPGTAGRVARKMRYIDEVAPRFRAGGLVRDVPEPRFARLWAVGVASASNSIPAFGGVLYGAAALRQDVNLVEGADGKHPTATPSYQDSQVDVADMTFVQTSNRLVWKEYHLTYSLLEALFEEATLPDLILLELPLLVVRGLHVATLADDDVRDEWNGLLDLMTCFWERYAGRCFPSNPGGPLVVHLGRKHFGAVLAAIQAGGVRGAVDPVAPELAGLVASEWDDLRRAGVNRVLKGLLRPGKRTAAYPYAALGKDALRAAPRLLDEQGLVGFHVQVGYRTPVWQVETLGPPDRWNSEALDRLAERCRARAMELRQQTQSMLDEWYKGAPTELTPARSFLVEQIELDSPRLDAWHYQPRYRWLVQWCRQYQFIPVSSIASVAKRRWAPKQYGRSSFHYIEISDSPPLECC